MTLDVHPCSAPEQSAVLHLLCRASSEGGRAEAVEAMLADARRGQVDLSHLMGAWCDERLVGALLAVESAGRSALIWPPRGVLAGQAQRVLEDALVAAALRRLEHAGVCFVQALLDPAQPGELDTLLRNGFRLVAELAFLRRPLARSQPLEALDPRVTYRTYSAERHGTLRRLIDETYKGTLDCPQLDGLRTIDDILAGHRGDGLFEPANWMLAYRAQRAVGCLLLARQPPSSAWELTYMGVVPSARGQGLGRQLTLKALSQVRRRRGSELTLAVDLNNAPALAIYRGLGFHPSDRRVLLVRTLGA